MTQKRDWNSIIRQAFAAGIVAGIIIEAYLLLTTVVPAHGSVVQTWQWIASAAIGQVAYSSPSYAALGLLFHFCVSIGWAGGYAYLAQQQTFMNQRWLISGLIYGLVVYIFMDIVLLGVRMFAPPPPLGLLNVLIAHMVFFGVPLAFVVARLDRGVSSAPSVR